MGTNIDIVLLLVILSSTFMAFRAWGHGREELTAGEGGKMGPGAQADDENQSFQAAVLDKRRRAVA